MECMDLWAIIPEMILAGCALGLVPVAGLSKGRGQNVVVFSGGVWACRCCYL